MQYYDYVSSKAHKLTLVPIQKSEIGNIQLRDLFNQFFHNKKPLKK